MKKGPLTIISFDFSINIVLIYKDHIKKHKEFVLSKQLLRSATGVGALIREANHAESKKDFIHKLGIALKECDESIYWLELLHATKYLDDKQFEKLSFSCTELLRMLKSSILTAKSNL